MTKLVQIAGVTAASAVAALALITAALGHAHPDTMSPDKGAVLQTAPTAVEITFVEEIQKTAGSYGLEVALDGGGSVTDGAPTIDPANAAHLSVALKPNLAAGRYVVNWHNVSSADGDAAEGAYSFYLKTEPTADDLAKDAALEQVGAEPADTPTDVPSSAQPTVIAPAPATSPAASAALPGAGSGPDAEGGGWGILIAAALGGFGAVIAAAAAFTMRRAR
jgi:methionine-rich copper-binding protein CopC